MTHVLTPTAREETVPGSSGLNIFVRSWRPSGSARAVVIICHGLNAHSGQYQWVGEQFAASGLAAYALDQRDEAGPTVNARSAAHVGINNSNVSVIIITLTIGPAPRRLGESWRQPIGF